MNENLWLLFVILAIIVMLITSVCVLLAFKQRLSELHRPSSEA